MCMLCASLDPSVRKFDNHGIESLGAGALAANLPTYSNDQIADYLSEGFWQDRGGQARTFDVQTGGTITVNINRLDALGRETAQKALDAWTAVSGLNFDVINGTAQISFDDNRPGAYAQSWILGDTVTKSEINVDDSWQSYGSYYLQTYIHEVGHALGLGHGGNYNGSAKYSRDAHFANESWQTTVMSYFSQTENTAVDASFAYLATAQIADILAIQNLYGTPTNVQTGDTVYGDGATTGQFGMDLLGGFGVSIFDSAGNDTINLSTRNTNQRLDLNDETFSDINGLVGNLSIARGAMIENAVTGFGADHVTGNEAANLISSGDGDDTLLGAAGDEVLTGGGGSDTLSGGSGADRYVYTSKTDAGDTITDFSLSDGDRVDIDQLLVDLEYTGDDPIGDGRVFLSAGVGGVWLVVD